MQSIQLFVPKFHTEECLAEIRECLETGWTGLGFKTVEFETAWKAFTGLPNAHFVNSATAGLQLALIVLKEMGGWDDMTEVITTPLTFVSTNHAILHAGLKPVFADVDEYLCLDPESVAARITDKTKAVMFVGLGGNTGQLSKVAWLCKDRGLHLILDAAHMAGTYLSGAHIGHQASVAVFSFHAVKNLPTADSGIVCFQSHKADAIARQYSWMGIDSDTYARTLSEKRYKWQYDVSRTGFKFHGNSVMAAIALAELPHLDDGNAQRRELAKHYDRLLEDSHLVKRVLVAPGCTSSRHLYQVLVESRDAVVGYMNNHGVNPGVHYISNTNYPMYAYAQRTCPVADYAGEHVISLPMHLRLTADDIRHVSSVLLEAVHETPDPAFAQ